MADAFVSEIRVFPSGSVPAGWALCDGQLLSVAQHPGLFALMGTAFGGDGESTFALPDLRGRAPMHPGQGPGLSPYALGDHGGSETVTLSEAQVPAHGHRLHATALHGDQPGPTGTLPATTGGDALYAAASALVDMAPEAVVPAGGGEPHGNMMPYLTFHFCIALEGIFPQPG